VTELKETNKMKKIRYRCGTGLKITINLFICLTIVIICLYGANYILSITAPRARKYTQPTLKVIERVGSDIKKQVLNAPKTGKQILNHFQVLKSTTEEEKLLDRQSELIEELKK